MSGRGIGKPVKGISGRTPAKVEALSKILLVTEGKYTEKDYFDRLIRYLKLSTVDVVTDPSSGSAPISVVSHALNVCKNNNKTTRYDIVYCVIDRDEHETFDEAVALVDREKAKLIKRGIKFEAIKSYPCFEYWLIMHFSKSRRPIIRTGKRSPGDNACDQLKKFPSFSGYTKRIAEDMFNELCSRHEDAMKNSSNNLTQARLDNSLNPSSEVHLIVKKIVDLHNQHQNHIMGAV